MTENQAPLLLPLYASRDDQPITERGLATAKVDFLDIIGPLIFGGTANGQRLIIGRMTLGIDTVFRRVLFVQFLPELVRGRFI
jgi:hypothetical protein